MNMKHNPRRDKYQYHNGITLNVTNYNYNWMATDLILTFIACHSGHIRLHLLFVLKTVSLKVESIVIISNLVKYFH